MLTELWRDRWCFACGSLRRFKRDGVGVWRCTCGRQATPGVAIDLSRREKEEGNAEELSGHGKPGASG